jgi:outer membrane protein assembly factor BamD (BamD/ComL family)
VNRALATLDRYDAAFAPGVLAEEAAVLRVTALMAGGKRAQARRLAEDFARRYPTSSYGPRVRALVETNF